MFQLLSIVLSYGALLLLLMPPSVPGIIATVAVFAFGTAWIIYRKVYKIAFWKNIQYVLLLVVSFTAAYLGLRFYNEWIDSLAMQIVADSLHIPLETMLLIGAVMLSTLSVPVSYMGIRFINQKLSWLNQKTGIAGSLVSCLLVSVVIVALAQVMIGHVVLSMGHWKFFWGVLIVVVTILFLYCLFGKIVPSIFVGAGFFMVISTINVYVWEFRRRLLEPLDIFSAGTAMNVMENYNLFPLPFEILNSWNCFIVIMLLLCCIQHKTKSELTVRSRCILLSICIACSAAICSYVSKLTTYHWEDEGAMFNGYILDFTSKLKELTVLKPDRYSKELIAQLADQYVTDVNGTKSEGTELPHIIVVMDEAFSDLHVIGDFSTNQEVTPFISSLKDNTISGYTLVSVFGGNTANSEYEFLTGNSMAWLSPNTVPFQQYLRSPAYSMVSYLKSSYDYKCVAMHPYRSSGWNRPAAYEYLGFDEAYFRSAFPRKQNVRNFVSDQEMFEFLIDIYEAQKDNPLLLYGVTMQNHGNYRYSGENYTQHISLNVDGAKFNEAEQYLSVIHETDKAVEYLITYFQNVDEDVVIVFFGDHQPKVEEEFYQAIRGVEEDTLDIQQLRYKVPFFIWTNYDIEEKYLDCVSLNYLSSYVYDAAGLALPPYNQFLRKMEEKIPSINVNGFYSPTAGGYLPLEEANEEEIQWLERYEILQYNNIFDRKHRNEILFPVLD